MSNSNRVTTAEFTAEIQKMLREYGDEVFKASEKAARKSARQAVKELKATPHVITGRYARGWATKTEGRNTASFRIVAYNRDVPGLPHLLNDSHVTGRYRGGHYIGDNSVTIAEEHAKASFLEGVESAL